MVRLRLYETLLLLPAQSFEGSNTHLLRMLVAEFTLTENPANTTTSQLRSVCHADDSVILGTWLQETDHRTIEDQVSSVLLLLTLSNTHMVLHTSTLTVLHFTVYFLLIYLHIISKCFAEYYIILFDLLSSGHITFRVQLFNLSLVNKF